MKMKVLGIEITIKKDKDQQPLWKQQAKCGRSYHGHQWTVEKHNVKPGNFWPLDEWRCVKCDLKVTKARHKDGDYSREAYEAPKRRGRRRLL